MAASGLFIFGGIAFYFARSLDLMALGAKSAGSLGINVRRLRVIVILLVAGLTSSSLAVGGALPFIGLIAPHMARQKVSPHIRGLLVTSAIYGAIMTVTADLIARTVRAPVDTDVGIITAIVGSPYFLWVLWRQTRQKGSLL
jgi:iron complex transport system permease protein